VKRTEGGPQIEAKDFRYGVNGFPKAKGLYRRGDNGAIQPDRFYRAWNVQFNGDEVTERGGQSEFCDTSEGCPIMGLYSSNPSWNTGDTTTSTVKNNEVPRLQWGEPTTGDPITYPNGKFSDNTGYQPERGLFSVPNFDPGPYATGGGWAVLSFAKDSFEPGHSQGTVVPRYFDASAMYLASMTRHGNKVALSVMDAATTTAGQKILLRAPMTTPADVYEDDTTDVAYTNITDAGVTYRSLDTLLTAAGASEVNIGAFLFSYNGDLYALYRRYNGTPQGLLRKWSGSGTTWSTVGTFPTMTVKAGTGAIPVPANWRAWSWGTHPWAWTIWDGAVYIPICRTSDDGGNPNYTSQNYNNLSILKFDGTAITEFYNYAVAGAKRSDAGTAGCDQLIYDGTNDITTLNVPPYLGEQIYIHVIAGRLFVSFLGKWFGQAGPAGAQYPWEALVFSSGGSLYGDTITTPSLIAVQGSTRPTLPANTSAYPSTSYPNWNNAPWTWVIKIGGVYYGFNRGSNVGFCGSASGEGWVEEDNRYWVYRSLDGLAWYKDFELTTASHSDTRQWTLGGAPTYVTVEV